MTEARTIPAKYIFLDVVGFTHNRSVEAQSDIVGMLNECVKCSVSEHEIPKDQIIYLPTGDGICISLLNIETPFDIHLLIALSIIQHIRKYNDKTQDDMRKFEVRIGINANLDNLVTDINDNQNIAGAGINMASRVMSMADGNQILVGESVFDTLRYREKYMSSFKAFRAKVKHGLEIPIYQYISEGHIGLNIAIPQAFQSPAKSEPKLNKLVAYYFAHAIKNRDFFMEKVQQAGIGIEAGTVLLWFLAGDALLKSEATAVTKPIYKTYKIGEATLEEQYQYYNSIDVHAKYALAKFIQSGYLNEHIQYFERSGEVDYRFIDPEGAVKLKKEWPDIWKEFGLVSPA